MVRKKKSAGCEVIQISRGRLYWTKEQVQQLDKVEQGAVGIPWEGKKQSIFASQGATSPDAIRTCCRKSPQGQEVGSVDTIFSERPREDEKAENFLIEMNFILIHTEN